MGDRLKRQRLDETLRVGRHGHVDDGASLVAAARALSLGTPALSGPSASVRGMARRGSTVVTPGREFRQIASNRLEGATLASMAVANGTFFIRSDTHLYRIGVRP